MSEFAVTCSVLPGQPAPGKHLVSQLRRTVTTRGIRQCHRQGVVDLVVAALDGQLYSSRVAVLGLSFKPHSDEVRDSPALDVAVQLYGLGASVVATDPQGISNARSRHPQLEVTEWPEFKEIDPVWARTLVKTPTIIDARNVLDPVAWRAAGWTYVGLGRP